MKPHSPQIHPICSDRRAASAGFTLIEIAVAVFIITLLLSSILVPLATQVEQRQISDAQKAIEEIKEALAGFAVANGYLPCPDLTAGANSNDGREDVTAATGACASVEGNIPWATLGTVAADPWGNRYRYRVTAAFAQRAPAALFSLASSANLQVCITAACATLLTSSAPNGAAAVILSHGKNGLGAVNSNTNAATTVPASADEQENTNGNDTFVYRAATTFDTGAGEFDDIVSWVSKFTLFNRMVAAGKLP